MGLQVRASFRSYSFLLDLIDNHYSRHVIRVIPIRIAIWEQDMEQVWLGVLQHQVIW